ncbi:MAG: hypothetical protein H0X40_07675 [Chthoniobacterales bacterium]|nr:hypothetical protein [Chthoniobacterales bacterium]
MNTPGIAAILVAFLVGIVFVAAHGWWRRIGIVCLVGSIATAGFFLMRDRRIGSGAARIAIGDSQAHVLALLGRPTQITDCSTGYGGYKRGELDKSEIAPGCVEEYWYYSFYFPASSTYSFDSDKKVIRKYDLNSP